MRSGLSLQTADTISTNSFNGNGWTPTMGTNVFRTNSDTTQLFTSNSPQWTFIAGSCFARVGTTASPRSLRNLSMRGHLEEYAFILVCNSLPSEPRCPILFADQPDFAKVLSV